MLYGSRGPRTEIAFVGSSPELREVQRWAAEHGHQIAATPGRATVCVVADEDVLDGFCAPDESTMLARARELGLTCLPPALAREHIQILPHQPAPEVQEVTPASSPGSPSLASGP